MIKKLAPAVAALALASAAQANSDVEMMIRSYAADSARMVINQTRENQIDFVVRSTCYESSGRYRYVFEDENYPEAMCAEVAVNQLDRSLQAHQAARDEENARLEARREQQRQAAAEAAALRANSLLPPEQVQDASKAMFEAYSLAGVAGMQEAENYCWREIPADEPARSAVAALCALMVTSGVMIEAGYAREQGRVPAPAYDAAPGVERAKSKMRAAGLSAQEVDSIFSTTVHPNIDMLLAGLINAGMQ